MTHLTAFSAFVQRFDACLKHIVVTHIGPTVPKIILLYPGNIGKAVIVAVMCFRFIFVMCQQRSTPSFGKFHRGIRIRLITIGGTGKKIGRNPIRLRQLRLLKFNIDLSGKGFITILHGRNPLGYLYAVHPGTGNITQSVRRSSTAIVRNILGQHLHISSR